MAAPSSPRTEQRQKARLEKLEEKWSVLFNQKTRAPVSPVHTYIDYLQQFCRSKEGLLSSDKMSSTHPVSYILQKLHVDLKMSYQQFIEDFCKSSNGGLMLLLSLLREIQKEAKGMTSLPSKGKAQNRKRLLTDELDCLVCIKFCLRAQVASSILLESAYGLESVASTLMSSHTKSRITALEIMSLILREPGGFDRNLDCFTYFRLKNCEPVRFKFLVSMLMSRPDGSLAFQICCMRFLNSLVTFAPTSNKRVFLQTELEMAGVDSSVLLMMTENSTSPDRNDLLKEIMDFQNSQVDVDSLLENQRSLQEKIKSLKDQLQISNMDTKKSPSPKSRPAPPPPVQSAILHQIVFSPIDNNSGDVCHNDNGALQPSMEVKAEYDKAPTSTGSYISSSLTHEKINIHQTNLNSEDNNQHSERSGLILPRRNMPFLNWVPLTDVENTIFKTLNYEAILHDIELFDLEESFRIGLEPNNNCKKLARNPMKNKIRFMEQSRAKNLAILQKRIGRDPITIKDFIMDYDVDALLSDNAELLLKFIPTKDEMRTIMTLDFELEDLDDAEQMLLQLMSVERLEDRLRLMIFMEQFSQSAELLLSQIKELHGMSSSILNCCKLKKLFEIILAIGNFINGNRKGPVLGFRVTSLPLLEQIRTGDRTKTLLEYIAEIVERHYSEVHGWYEELQLGASNTVSFQSLSASVKELEEGVNILRQEITHSSSTRLTKFEDSALGKYRNICARFREMESVYQAVCSMFGERKEELESQEFFRLLFNFAEAYKQADKQLVRQRWRKGITLGNPHLNNRKTISTEQTVGIQSTQNILEENITPIRISSTEDTVLCNMNPPEQEHCMFTFDPLGVFQKPFGSLHDQNPCVENWVVNSPPPFACADVRIEESSRMLEQSSDCAVSVNDNDSIFDYDTDSEDSAFVGSEGQYLRSCGSKSLALNNELKGTDILQTSTSRRPSPPPEPVPDYSVCGSVYGTMNSVDDDIVKVLSEFDGTINGYCSRSTRATPGRFITMKSIIYI